MARGTSQVLVNSEEPDSIPGRISRIFDEVQISSANHPKNKVTLYMVYLEATSMQAEEIGMHVFESTFFLVIARLLDTKKCTFGDRVVKFFIEFLKYIHEKGKAVDSYLLATHYGDTDDTHQSSAQTFTDRIVQELLKRGSFARAKNIRYRSAELCADIALGLALIHQSLYYSLREILLRQINDKEWTVRQHAAIALCALLRVDDTEELTTRGLYPLTEILLDTLSYDVNEYVRLSVLQKLDLNKDTLDDILDRTRDTAVQIRKEVYSKLEKSVLLNDEDDDLEIGSAHPRTLSMAQRDLIVKNGIGDRDSSVRDSAVKVFTKWVNTIVITQDSGPQGPQEGSLQATPLVQLMTLFNLHDDDSLSEAIIKIFEANPRILNNIPFCTTDWSSFTPETAFLTRVYVEHCVKNKFAVQLDEVLPAVMVFAFHLQEYVDRMVEAIQRYHEKVEATDIDDVTRAILQDEIDSQQMITSEMLKISIRLDYGDEIGRSQMEQLVCGCLVQKDLPEGLLVLCIDLLREMTTNDTDLIRIIDGTVVPSLLRDREDDDDLEDGHPSNSKQEENDILDMRCLVICEYMLTLVNVVLEDSYSIRAIEKIVHSTVSRKDDDQIKERGYRCFALIGLINESVAMKAFKFFLGRMKNDLIPEELRLVATQAIFDLIMWYGQETAVKWCDLENLTTIFVEALDQENPAEDMRALLCEGLAKLMGEGVLVDERITNLLVENYFSPRYTKNQCLKQCLSFFFHNYCVRSLKNQERITETFLPTFLKLCSIHCENTRWLYLEVDSIALIARFSDMILTWTHPNYLQEQDRSQKYDVELDTQAHFKLAFEIIQELLQQDSKLFRKHQQILVQVLSHKLYLPEKVNVVEVRHFDMLINKLFSVYLFPNTTTKNALTKFHAHFVKKYEKQLEAFSEADFRALEEYQEELIFLDKIIPTQPKLYQIQEGSRKRRKKRRLRSLTDRSSSEASDIYVEREDAPSKFPRLSVRRDEIDSPQWISPYSRSQLIASHHNSGEDLDELKS
ncbi:nuclear condensing complex subunit [Lentinula detonsa]|uniref:Nuclear condensing complex subunit n=1 Tax=Lentinula detonsa TaxID=2804962 RepID=A0AA38Q1U2_9AGAR|nr:nuclear condensing complex subunit [Lentinula detonsa]